MAEAEASEINTNNIQVETVLGQQILQEEDPSVDKGKGIALESNEEVVGQGRMESVDEGGNSYEDDESNEFFEEGYDLDSEDIEKILSRVEIQGKNEWKTISKKTKKNKKKKTAKKGPKSKMHDSEASSLGTEVIPIYPRSKVPLKKDGSRYFKTKTTEVRPPDTAFGCL